MSDSRSSPSGILEDADEAREKRRERRFRCIAGPAVSAAKMELKRHSRDLREHERMARKRYHDEHAEKCRKAANAMEDALSELEKLPEDFDE